MVWSSEPHADPGECLTTAALGQFVQQAAVLVLRMPGRGRTQVGRGAAALHQMNFGSYLGGIIVSGRGRCCRHVLRGQLLVCRWGVCESSMVDVAHPAQLPLMQPHIGAVALSPTLTASVFAVCYCVHPQVWMYTEVLRLLWMLMAGNKDE